MWWKSLVAIAVITTAGAATARGGTPTVVRCGERATADLAIDGLLDDWPTKTVARAGASPDGEVTLRCAWDGDALAIAVQITDDRVVRVPSGKAHEDRVELVVSAGGKPVVIGVLPGNAIAKTKLSAPSTAEAAESAQPGGFSIEARIAAANIAGFTASTPSLSLRVALHDSDRAAGGDDADVELVATIELAESKDLLDDFLVTTRLKRSDIKLDVLADLDPDRNGKERVVAGGTVIGVLTDQYSFVSLPVTRPSEVRELKLLPLGKKGHQIVTAVVRQSGNGGSRDLLMLWTVWSGQLQPLAQIEVRKELGGKLLEATWKLTKGKRGPELWVEAVPAVGWTEETWQEERAEDADSIVVPWDPVRRGVAYTLVGAEVARRDLPPAKRRK